MVRDWVDYLAQPRATQYNLQPGEPIVFRLPGQGTGGGQLTAATGSNDLVDLSSRQLRTPTGDTIELTSERENDATVFRSSRTRLPGEYELEIDLADQPVPFHVARSTEESELSMIDEANWRRIKNMISVDPSAERAT